MTRGPYQVNPVTARRGQPQALDGGPRDRGWGLLPDLGAGGPRRPAFDYPLRIAYATPRAEPFGRLGGIVTIP